MPSFLSVSDEYGQECLEMFRQKLMPNFPFVVIPSDHSAAELRNKRPALYGAIIVASSFSSIKTQTAYGEELLRYLTEELLMKGEKSLELLQALLVYTAWYVQWIEEQVSSNQLHTGTTMCYISREGSPI